MMSANDGEIFVEVSIVVCKVKLGSLERLRCIWDLKPQLIIFVGCFTTKQ